MTSTPPGGPDGPSTPVPDSLPALPHTWRPRFVPVVAAAMGVVLVAAALGMWVGLPAAARAQINILQSLTLGLVLLALLAGLYRLARLKVRADDAGLTIVNVLRTRQLEWAQVLSVNLRSGDPWVQLDVDDGTTVQAMAIQSADGQHGRTAARELSRMVAQHTRTQRND
ncbi:PH domain-containing protein [Actinopolymorpha sp. B9G3]|uniref:PH domain-containing protein n=1 Tax=Actinopolymorpha sp. B9G3 TaxID=3158970 RepID=UPI0032D97DC5